MNCMVTGHRELYPFSLSLTNKKDISIEYKILELMIEWCKDKCDKYNDVSFITGMAIGADQLFANAVIKLKQNGYNCELIAAVPFKGQEIKWSHRHQLEYFSILKQCDKIVYVSSPGYEHYKMDKRNRWIVNNSDIALAVWNGKRNGGTFNCIKYILVCKKEINYLDLNTMTIVT